MDSTKEPLLNDVADADAAKEPLLPKSQQQRSSAKAHGPVYGLVVSSGASFFVTLMGALAKILSSAHIPVFEIVLARSLFMVVCCTLNFLRDRSVNPLGNRRKLLVFRGFMGFGSVTSIYAAVAFLPLGDSTALSFLAPLVVALTSPLLLHETPSRVALLSVPACLAGVLMVAQPSFIFHGTPLPLVGVLIGLTQPIFSAGAKMCVRALRSSEVDTVIIFYMAAISSLCSLFLCLVIPSQHFKAPNSALHWAILVVGVGASGLGNQTCMTVGMRYAPGAFAAISTSYLAMVWAVLLGALFFNERPSVLELCGSGLIIVVTLALSYWEARSTEHSRKQAAVTAKLVAEGPAEDCVQVVVPPGTPPGTDLTYSSPVLDDTSGDGTDDSQSYQAGSEGVAETMALLSNQRESSALPK
ncbi:hypothetical protein V8C86DRAFT_15272 [Haematococcus lacustris]